MPRTYLEDVAAEVSDEDDPNVVHRLVDVADVGRLDRRVLAAGRDQLRERRQERLDPRARQVEQLPRDDGWRTSGSQRGGKEDQ